MRSELQCLSLLLFQEKFKAKAKIRVQRIVFFSSNFKDLNERHEITSASWPNRGLQKFLIKSEICLNIIPHISYFNFIFNEILNDSGLSFTLHLSWIPTILVAFLFSHSTFILT